MTYTFPLLLITCCSSFQHLTRTYKWRTLFPYSWSPDTLHFNTSHAHTNGVHFSPTPDHLILFISTPHTHIRMAYTFPLLLITCCSSFQHLTRTYNAHTNDIHCSPTPDHLLLFILTPTDRLDGVLYGENWRGERLLLDTDRFCCSNIR